MSLLEVNGITKVFGEGTINERTALSSVSLSLEAGDFVTVIGNNGAGKSTLLYALSGMDTPTLGTITFAGEVISDLSQDGLVQRDERVYRGVD